MKTLYLITFSCEGQKGSITERHTELIEQLRSEYEVNLINIKNIDQLTDNDFKLIFLASDAVEHYVVHNYERLPHPLFLLTDGYNNSLSSAMELKAWANSQSIKAEIIYSGLGNVMDKINTLYQIHKTVNSLKKKRIGVIGTPNQWFVSSSVNYLLAQRRWGIEYVDIPVEELIREFGNITEDEVGEQAAVVAGNARECIEATPEDLLDDMRIYKALKNIIDKYRLNALALNSQKIFEIVKTSCCVAISMLNNDGIPAINESDLQSIFTALVLKELTGEISFLGHISKVDCSKNEVMMAACCVSTLMADNDYTIRSHYETSDSVAIQAHIPVGKEVTVVKCGGESLDEFFVAAGETVEREYEERCCRTQATVRLDRPVSYFIKNPIGNNHLLVKNNHKKLIKEFFKYSSSKRIG